MEAEGVPMLNPGVPLGVIVRLMVKVLVDSETTKLPDFPKLIDVLSTVSRALNE